VLVRVRETTGENEGPEVSHRLRDLPGSQRRCAKAQRVRPYSEESSEVIFAGISTSAIETQVPAQCGDQARGDIRIVFVVAAYRHEPCALRQG